MQSSIKAQVPQSLGKARDWDDDRTHKGRLLQNEGNDVKQTAAEIVDAMRSEAVNKAEHYMMMMMMRRRSSTRMTRIPKIEQSGII